MWIKRSCTDRLTKLTASRPVVLLTGARQTGKSSLLKKTFPRARYVSFDHLRQVEAAKGAPERFLAQFDGPTVLDEVQYVPELFRALKIKVDEDREICGQWLLTGSQRYELMEHISESLAGRISIVGLETLSAAELRASRRPALADHLWRGGYPELWGHPGLDVADFFESYLRTYVERDLKQIIDVKNLSDFRRCIKMLAVRIGQLLNSRDIAADVGVSDVTIRKWIHALEMSGLVYLLPPFHANIGKRLVKSPKLYFADHGLACHLLGIDSAAEWQAHTHCGNLWENFVLMELVKTEQLTPGRDMFFYRDASGVEIDFLIERGRSLALVEAKVGERLDQRKLSFGKVVSALGDKYETSKFVAHNVDDKRPARLGDYVSFNPLRCDFQAAAAIATD